MLPLDWSRPVHLHATISRYIVAQKTAAADRAVQLVDATGSSSVEKKIRRALEAIDDVRVADLHLWEIGPNRRSCVVTWLAPDVACAHERMAMGVGKIVCRFNDARKKRQLLKRRFIATQLQ